MKIHPKLIGIAGGSGAGKSTLCTRLMDEYPDHIGMIQLDDYFKPSTEVPQFNGIESWDHPESLYLDKLARDLKVLRRGESVEIMTKNLRLNPDYVHTNKRILVEFMPYPIMLVEGFLVLYEEKVREQLETSFWLEVDHATRWARRVHFKDDLYEKNVQIPSFQKYALPTRDFAEHVIDVTGISTDDVYKRVMHDIKGYL